MSQNRPAIYAAGSVVVVTLLLYFRVLDSWFCSLDDGLYIVDNMLISQPSWGSLRELWSPERALSGYFVEYFPLRDSVYWLTARLFGVSAPAFHGVNILAHLLCSLAVLRFLRTWGFDWAAATFGALIFVAHPAHTESVAWISGLKDPLYALCVVTCFDAHLRWLRGRRPGWLALSLIALIASLLIKSMGIVVFPVIFLLGLWVTRRVIQSAVNAIPYAIICLAFLRLYLLIGANNDVIRQIDSGFLIFSIVSWNTLWYVALTIFPYDLNIYHAVLPFAGSDWRTVLMIIFWILAIFIYGYTLMRRREVALWLTFFMVFLVPVLGFISIPVYYADRYLYLSLLAPSVLLARVFTEAPRWRPLLGVLLLLFGVRTALRSEQWRSNVEIMEEAVAQQGGQLPELYVFLGATHVSEGDPARAVFAYEEALRIDTRYVIERDEVASRVREHWRANAWGGLSKARRNIGDNAGALAAIKEVTTRLPLFPSAWIVRSNLEAALGLHADSINSSTRALQLDPHLAPSYFNRALSRFDIGAIDDGRSDLRRALELEAPSICPLLIRYEPVAPAAAAAEVRAAIAASCSPSG